MTSKAASAMALILIASSSIMRCRFYETFLYFHRLLAIIVVANGVPNPHASTQFSSSLVHYRIESTEAEIQLHQVSQSINTLPLQSEVHLTNRWSFIETSCCSSVMIIPNITCGTINPSETSSRMSGSTTAFQLPSQIWLKG
jgi:hypothetical protein